MRKSLALGLADLGSVIVLTLVVSACASASAPPTAAGSAAPTSPPANPVIAQAAPTSAPVAATQAPPTAQVIQMQAAEYQFTPSVLTVQPGDVTIQLANIGPQRQHNFYLKDPSGNIIVTSDPADVGTTETIAFTLTQPGVYQYYCNVDSHADRGEVGTITVAGA